MKTKRILKPTKAFQQFVQDFKKEYDNHSAFIINPNFFRPNIAQYNDRLVNIYENALY